MKKVKIKPKPRPKKYDTLEDLEQVRFVLTEKEYDKQFHDLLTTSNEEAIKFLFKQRHKYGYKCPKCHSKAGYRVSTRNRAICLDNAGINNLPCFGMPKVSRISLSASISNHKSQSISCAWTSKVSKSNLTCIL